YSKPGKGISKEEAARRNYFDILGRHFWDLVKLNLLFVLCNIIFIGAAVLLALPYLLNIETVIDSILRQPNILLPPLPFIPFMFMGPFIAGLTYVLRNWSRQEHAFLVSDFFEHTKKNWKQGLILSVLSTVITYLFLTAVIFYLKQGLPSSVILSIALVLSVMLLTMSFYTYPMVVTFDMKLKDIIKNAWIFSMAKLPQNLFFLVIIAAVHILLMWYLPVVWVLLMGLVLIAWTGYTINYYVWHVMNKYMMSQIPAEQPADEPVFEDKK
ncbi:MAG: YesL family protein, partial [Clostridia bacterium]